MKRTMMILLSLALVTLCAFALADVEINETNFPDASFRTSVLEDFDADQDGILSDGEITATTKMDVSERCISSLEGIQYFTSLKELFCKGNYLTELDVSGNSLLEHLDCEANDLKSLNLSGNGNLVDLCATNNPFLTALDVSHNPKLIKLWTLDCGFTTLDIRKCPCLVEVAGKEPAVFQGRGYMYSDTEKGYVLVINQDVELLTGETAGTPTPAPTATPEPTPEPTPSPSPAPTKDPEEGAVPINQANFPDEKFREKVRQFDTNGNGTLSEAEISSANTLSCANSQIKSMEGIRYLTSMMYLYCNGNELKELDLRGLDSLRQLYCQDNQITELKVTGADILKDLVQKYPRKSKEGYDEFEWYFIVYVYIGGVPYERDASWRLRVDPFVKVIAGDFVSEPSVPAPTPEATATPEPTPEPTQEPEDPSTATVKGLRYSLNSKKKTAVFTQPKDRKITSVTLPDTIKVSGKTYKVTEIAANACKGMSKLAKVSIGKNVTKIGKNAFYGCKVLKAVTGGAGVTSIGDSAFASCVKLASVPAFAKLTTIGANAYKGCKELPKITLSAKVKSIGKNAFNGCAKLKTIVIKTKLLTDKAVGANAFKGIYSKPTMTCPKGMAKKYKTLLLKKGMPKKATFK